MTFIRTCLSMSSMMMWLVEMGVEVSSRLRMASVARVTLHIKAARKSFQDASIQNLEVLLVASNLVLVAPLHLRQWVDSYLQQNRGGTINLCLIVLMGLALSEHQDPLITRRPAEGESTL
jgi:triphosphoribosyl-dephospho-CoA synthetase